MISPKKLIKLARKWQKKAASTRKRISLPRRNYNIASTDSSTSSEACKGFFVVYTNDQKRFVIPLLYLNNYVFIELLKMSEEEFGLTRDGPIALPCDAAFMEYILFIIQRGAEKDLARALLSSIATSCYSLPSASMCQEQICPHIAIWFQNETPYGVHEFLREIYYPYGKSKIVSNECVSSEVVDKPLTVVPRGGLANMISPKKLIKLARKWQNRAVSARKRISMPRRNDNIAADDCSMAFEACKGCFVVYTNDQSRFVIPLLYLNNYVFIELLKMSEEEFGLPGDGPITLPCDAAFMEYILLIIQKGAERDLARALLSSITTSCYSLPSFSLCQEQICPQIAIWSQNGAPFGVYEILVSSKVTPPYSFLFNYSEAEANLTRKEDLASAVPGAVHQDKALEPETISGDNMISPKKLIKLARKWQKRAATARKRISLPRRNGISNSSDCSTSSKACKGHFVVCSADWRWFVIPLSFLNNYIFLELIRMSENEFGLPSDGPIVLPCDGVFIEYILNALQRGISKDLAPAMLSSFATTSCSLLSSSMHQEHSYSQLVGCA
ncbi:Small auxin-up RNA [Dillenia turbinata]|uniref:Small auxin-up RNA n=1 Tax=Dillenia turbinata TaxID=194707 RepID=A0AAN8UU23_9MAGN